MDMEKYIMITAMTMEPRGNGNDAGIKNTTYTKKKEERKKTETKSMGKESG